MIFVRYRKKFISILETEVDYSAISRIQVISLAKALIPFFARDDAKWVLIAKTGRSITVSRGSSNCYRFGLGPYIP